MQLPLVCHVHTRQMFWYITLIYPGDMFLLENIPLYVPVFNRNGNPTSEQVFFRDDSRITHVILYINIEPERTIIVWNQLFRKEPAIHGFSLKSQPFIIPIWYYAAFIPESKSERNICRCSHYRQESRYNISIYPLEMFSLENITLHVFNRDEITLQSRYFSTMISGSPTWLLADLILNLKAKSSRNMIQCRTSYLAMNTRKWSSVWTSSLL